MLNQNEIFKYIKINKVKYIDQSNNTS